MQFRYKGFHENAYIHSDFLKLNPGPSNSSPQVILIRLVDWNASHDIGQKGLSGSVIQEFISLMNCRAEMKILSEKPLPAEWQHYALQIEPHQLHDYLNHVKLYIGEGATLASECALKGIPAIYVNSRSAGVIEAQAGARMLYHLKNSDGVIAKAKGILSDPDSMAIHKARANQFLKDKINLSRLLVWFISNYPESHHIMKQNPDYQYNIR